ncbi:albusnodin/ikarugamycin family macrolactam cyclase [Promicromonospora sp. NPDC060271]|uniref:albusnodin/ikarugamycin family macrolactam cyclase n=1 Tax=Promicromonospora sp. NPDC060271 TaxID=3347089 RepID=UPI0036480629
MRSFGGSITTGAGLPSRPAGSRVLQSRYAAMWLLGDWPDSQVRILDGPDWWCVVLGDVTCGDKELAQQARRFAARLETEPLIDRGGNSHVVWADARRVIATGDVAGTRLVFHVVQDRTAHFASSSHVLADLLGTGVDPGWLALRLSCPDIVPLSTRSAYEGVAAVPPSTMLVLRSGEPPAIVDRPQQDPKSSLVGGGERVREALRAAVHARLSGGVTADLSGGLDSSSVAALAAPAVPLIGLTLDSGQAGNEDLAHAKRIAGTLPMLRHEVRQIPDAVLPYTDLDLVPHTDEPWSDAVLYARTRWWHHQLQDLGSAVHLTGDGGDAVLSGSLAYLADLSRNLPRLVHEARAWAQLRTSAPLPILVAAVQLAGSSERSALRRTARELSTGRSPRRGAAGRLRWFGAPDAAWLTAEGRRIAAECISMPGHPAADRTTVGDRIARNAVLSFGRDHRIDLEIAETHGMRQMAPFMTDAVVRACLSVPVRQRTSAFVAKPLLRTALHEHVPALVLDRSTKGDYTALHYAGLARNASDLRRVFADSRLVESGLLDYRYARSVLDRAAQGADVRHAALNDVIATEVWLRTDAMRSRVSWTTGEDTADDAPLPTRRSRYVHTDA